MLLKLALVLAVIPFGSTGAFAMNVATLVFAVVTALAVVLTPGSGSTAGAVRAAMLVGAGLVVFMLLQSVPGGGGLLPPNPIWAEASRVLGAELAATTSVAPAVTLSAIPSIAMPFLAFAAALRVMRDDADALGMIRFLALFGGVCAAFGIVQFSLFPEALLLSPKRAYLDSLTATFVNRNSAATYLGCTIVLLAALLQLDLRGRSLRNVVSDLLFDRHRPRWRYRRILDIVLLAICIFALLLTKSRAGIASTMVAVTALMAVTSAIPGLHAEENASRSAARRMLRPLVIGGATLASAMALFFVFGGQTILRAQTRGLEDGRFCMYPRILAATRDAWPFGTGGGTFSLVFPGYRDSVCGLYGVVERAHQFFLEGAMTLGFAMPLACLVVYAVLFAILVRGLRQRRLLRPIPAAGLAVVLLVTLHDMVDFSLQIPGIAANTALVLAACCAVSLRSLQRRSSTGQDA